MSEVGDVTLNIYKLSNNSNSNNNNGISWASRLLPAIGMGTYHTSITVAGTNYTFAAQHGIVQSSSRRIRDEGTVGSTTAPMVFQESLFLGYCRLNRGQLQEIVQRLKIPFSETAYHLVHRNCNHFTETLAMALLKYEELIEGHVVMNVDGNYYPAYINRLATTSSVFVGHDEDIVPCNIVEEATVAVGAHNKVGWGLSPSKSFKHETTSKARQNEAKKTLSDAQKKALAKIRKT